MRLVGDETQKGTNKKIKFLFFLINKNILLIYDLTNKTTTDE